MLQILRDHGSQPRLLHPAKPLVTINGENKTSLDKVKFKQYLLINRAPEKVLEGKLQTKEVNYKHENTDNK